MNLDLENGIILDLKTGETRMKEYEDEETDLQLNSGDEGREEEISSFPYRITNLITREVVKSDIAKQGYSSY